MMNNLKETSVAIEETAGCSSCAGCSYAPDYNAEAFYCWPGDCTGHFDDDMQHCSARDAPAPLLSDP